MRAAQARVVGGLAVATLVLGGCGFGTTTTTASTNTTTRTSAVAAPTPSTSVEPLAATSPTASAKPLSGAVKQADGSLLVTDAKAGFQVAVPRGYSRITSRAQLDRIAKAGSKALRGRLPSVTAAAFAKNVKVFAVNRLTGATVTLGTTPANGELPEDLAGEADTVKTILETQLKATGVTTKDITVDGGPALRVDGTIPVQSLKFHVTEIYAISNDTLYVTAIGGPARASEKVVTTVVDSLHFLT